jgi:Kdo2-lipid IVA lauroyltransferase/acyltransferase
MSYYLALWFSRFCCCLPGRLCDTIGELLGWVTWPFVPGRRKKMAEENIMFCLKVCKNEAERIAKASWVRFGPMLFEVLRFPVLKKCMHTYVEIEGRENLEKAIALGHGAVIATAHSGNWELMGGALAMAGFPIVGVAMKQKEAGMDRFINEYRRLVGMHVTYKTGVREMFQLLGKGWFIGLIMDQDTNRHDGIILDFFGRPTNCVPGPASLARFRKAPIFPVFITRLQDGRHRLIIHAPLFVEQTQDKHADIMHATQRLNQIIEEHIRAYPEEWFWLHDRWKSVR